MVSAFQVLKNHSFFAANWRCARPMVWRNATASAMDSPVSAGPPGPSIMAAVMSLETMMGYSGDVEACSMYDSLKRECGIGLRPSRICSSEACDSAASSLCVECVAKIVGPLWSLGSPCMACRPL